MSLKYFFDSGQFNKKLQTELELILNKYFKFSSIKQIKYFVYSNYIMLHINDLTFVMNDFEMFNVYSNYNTRGLYEKNSLKDKVKNLNNFMLNEISRQIRQLVYKLYGKQYLDDYKKYSLNQINKEVSQIISY